MASMEGTRATETSASTSPAEVDADTLAARRAEVVDILSTALVTLILEGPNARSRIPPKRSPAHALRIIHVPDGAKTLGAALPGADASRP